MSVWFEDESKVGGFVVRENVRKSVMLEWTKLNQITKELNTLEGLI